MHKEALDQVFGTSFDLVRDNYKARCPFHQERTPSFYVHKYENVCHCFGCGISGSIDSLGAKASGRSEQEVRQLLDLTPENFLARGNRENGSSSKTRTIPESWLAPFKKGVHKYVISRGLHPSILEACGSRYDSALKRQVFPHYARDGKFLGAVGRTCREEDPKWYFYWGYDKACALWRPRSLRNVSTSRKLVLVEGVFDALWISQHTDFAPAASLGTSISNHQIAELRSYADHVVIGFDNDDAGRAATEKVYRALRTGGPDISFVQWPAHAKDWMDLSKEQILETLGSTINNVQRNLIQNSARSSRVPSEQEKSTLSVGTGHGQDYHINSNGGEVILPG